MADTQPPLVSRRALAAGTAWTVPTVMAVAATPAFAASPGVCPDGTCFQPIAATTISAVAVSGNVGTLAITAPPPPSPTGFGFISTCSAAVSVGVVTVNSATLTMVRSTGATTTYQADVSAALGAAAGALGVTGVYFGGVFTFPNVAFPNGSYIGLNPPVRPSQLCVNVTFPVSFGVGGLSSCTTTICFDAQLSPTAGTVILGNGIVTYTSLWTF